MIRGSEHRSALEVIRAEQQRAERAEYLLKLALDEIDKLVHGRPGPEAMSSRIMAMELRKTLENEND